MAKALQAYGIPLETVTNLKYLGRILTASDDDCLEVVGNLRKVRKSLACLLIILGREGDSPRVSGMLFKVVVHAVLLFGAETRLINPEIYGTWGGSNTGLCNGSRGDSPVGYCTGPGTTLCWRRQCGKRGLKIFSSMW